MSSNVAIVYRFAEGQNDRLPDLAADLMHRQVDRFVSALARASVIAEATSFFDLMISPRIVRRMKPRQHDQESSSTGSLDCGCGVSRGGGSACAITPLSLNTFRQWARLSTKLLTRLALWIAAIPPSNCEQ